MNGLKQRLNAICRPPKPAPWKRTVLWIVSLLSTALCIFAAWELVQFPFTNIGAYIGAWMIIGIFGIFGIAGVIVAAVGDDWWVALLLGEPN